MTKIFNRKEVKARRRYLSNNMTTAEIILWSKLKNGQLGGLKFRRQASIKSYIVDFYCPSKRLAVELDGDVHGYAARIASDRRRQEEIQKLGVRVLRFANSEVKENLEGVLMEILRVANDDQCPSVSFLSSEEGNAKSSATH